MKCCRGKQMTFFDRMSEQRNGAFHSCIQFYHALRFSDLIFFHSVHVSSSQLFKLLLNGNQFWVIVHLIIVLCVQQPRVFVFALNAQRQKGIQYQAKAGRLKYKDDNLNHRVSELYYLRSLCPLSQQLQRGLLMGSHLTIMELATYLLCHRFLG